MLVSKQESLCLSSIMNLLDICKEYADVKTNTLNLSKATSLESLKTRYNETFSKFKKKKKKNLCRNIMGLYGFSVSLVNIASQRSVTVHTRQLCSSFSQSNYQRHQVSERQWQRPRSVLTQSAGCKGSVRGPSSPWGLESRCTCLKSQQAPCLFWDPWELRLPRNEAREPYRIMGQAAAGLILCEIGESGRH